MIRPPPTSTLFPSSTLFRSSGAPLGPLGGAPRPRHTGPVDQTVRGCSGAGPGAGCTNQPADGIHVARSEEHTSELQSRQYLVCRLLLEKKKRCTNVHQDMIR